MSPGAAASLPRPAHSLTIQSVALGTDPRARPLSGASRTRSTETAPPFGVPSSMTGIVKEAEVCFRPKVRVPLVAV